MRGRLFETTRTRRLVLLLVGASAALVAKCREAAGRAGAILRDCDLGLLSSTVADWQPLALLVPEAVYAPRSAELEALARRNEVIVVRLPGDETQEELDGRLSAFVSELDES